VSVHVESWAWQQRVGNAAAKLVLIKIAQNANDDGYAFPGQARIAEETELSKRTVVEKIAYLIEQGWLVVERRATAKGYRKTNGYLIPRYVASLSAKPAPGSESLSADDRSLSAAPAPKQSVEQSEDTPSKTSSSRVERANFDALFDAFAEHVQKPPETPSHRSGYVKLVREALAAGWTPEKVPRMAEAYRQHETLGEAMLTLAALLKWAPMLKATEASRFSSKDHLQQVLERRRASGG
jgi:DNA-binding transcriptional MocR family regulator